MNAKKLVQAQALVASDIASRNPFVSEYQHDLKTVQSLASKITNNNNIINNLSDVIDALNNDDYLTVRGHTKAVSDYNKLCDVLHDLEHQSHIVVF